MSQDRLISLNAAIDALRYAELGCELEAIKKLPPAQQWIPCSERLPKDEEEVIVSIRDDSGDNTLDYSSCGWYACAGDFWVVDNEANNRVVAWMPRPTPYRPERGEHYEGR